MEPTEGSGPVLLSVAEFPVSLMAVTAAAAGPALMAETFRWNGLPSLSTIGALALMRALQYFCMWPGFLQ